MTRPDHFQAEDPEPLLRLPMDPQYQETSPWGCVLGIAVVLLAFAGAVGLLAALRSLG
jgi:hypothetical protein